VLDQRGVDLELMVIDNGSSDDSVAALRSAHPAARVIEAGENLGFAEGCNRGIDATRAPWVLLLNSDAALEPGALAYLVEEARKAPPEVAALQPAMFFTADPARLNSTGIQLFADGTARDRSFGLLAAGRAESPDVFGTTAGAALYRRSALDRVRLPSGVLDRGFFMYMEDVDLAWRLQLAGYSARYVAPAAVRHRYQASVRHRETDFVGRHCRENRLRVLLKNATTAMMARGMWHTTVDLLHVVRNDGLAGIFRVAGACRAALDERGLVSRMTRVGRREVERRWVGRA
jgi:GT2 family glycosyltransferase